MRWLKKKFTNFKLKSIAQEIRTSQDLADAVRLGFFGGNTGSTGIAVTPTRAMQCTAVLSCVNVLASSVAKLPFPLFRRDQSGGNEKMKKHAVHRLLNRRPNPFQTPFQFRQMMTAHSVLQGNGYAYISRASDGRPTALIPLNPDAVTPKQNNDFTITYEYTPPGRATRTLQKSDVLHIMGLTLDGFSGVNRIKYARETIGLSLAAEQYGARFFGHDATPPFVFSHPTSSMTDEGVRNFKKAWGEQHAGVENSHVPAVLREGMTIQPLGLSPEDSQFLETRQFQAVDIARLFGVPPHKIGILDRATFSNIEQQALEFVTDAMDPWLVGWEQSVACSLLTEDEAEDYYLRHQVQALLRGDSKSRGEFYTRMVQNGAMSPNEVRAKEEMNPRDGGDIFLTPVNMTTTPAPTKDAAND